MANIEIDLDFLIEDIANTVSESLTETENYIVDKIDDLGSDINTLNEKMDKIDERFAALELKLYDILLSIKKD